MKHPQHPKHGNLEQLSHYLNLKHSRESEKLRVKCIFVSHGNHEIEKIEL